MLISLAENAVKHGVEPKIGPAQVVVSAARTAAGDLAHHGGRRRRGLRRRQQPQHSGLGLANIRERSAADVPGRGALMLKARPAAAWPPPSPCLPNEAP
jgi:LytS/YehU family sensor histidine kinase